MTTTTNTTNANANARSNIDPAKQAVFDQFEELGKREGEGQLARIMCAEQACARGKEGLLDPEDAEGAYSRYMQGVTGIVKEIGGAETTQTEKQRGAELKHFIVLGANKLLDGVELLDAAKQRMIKIRAAREEGKRGRAWVMLLDFARAQNKSPERALTIPEIDKLFEQQLGREREVADLLWGARNTINKCNEGEEDRKLRDAIDLIDLRIVELGGTTKQKKAAKLQAKKDAEKAREKAAKEKATKVKRK